MKLRKLRMKNLRAWPKNMGGGTKFSKIVSEGLSAKKFVDHNFNIVSSSENGSSIKRIPLCIGYNHHSQSYSAKSVEREGGGVTSSFRRPHRKLPTLWQKSTQAVGPCPPPPCPLPRWLGT